MFKNAWIILFATFGMKTIRSAETKDPEQSPSKNRASTQTESEKTPTGAIRRTSSKKLDPVLKKEEPKNNPDSEEDYLDYDQKEDRKQQRIKNFSKKAHRRSKQESKKNKSFK